MTAYQDFIIDKEVNNYSPSFESFSMLTKENRKLALKLKESFPIMRDKTSFNRSIRSATLNLFDRV